MVGTYPGKDGLVRSVKVRIGDPNLSGDGSRLHPPTELERPIQKSVLLLPQEERPGFPDGEPSFIPVEGLCCRPEVLGKSYSSFP